MTTLNRVRHRRASLALAAIALLVIAGVVGRATADAPDDRFTYPNGQDTVFDTKTGLTWQRAVPSQTYSQDAALTYCATATGLPGTGWRLPSMKELETIVDESRWGPAIATTAFPSTPADAFWSSSLVAGTPNAWGVHFDEGNTFDVYPWYAYRVRCVR
jgi:Protein of unknown function (DUF1566)